ncbi:hypothetical protein K3495_g1564 [Podosphaera aphanis]|nr:hypothetical protein K3495_g1564 [Podosphaera aphanis]
MPVVKTTHHTADSVKDRVQKTTKTQGLARKPKALHASEALIPGKSISLNDTVMIDAENISTSDPSSTTENLGKRAPDPTDASTTQTEPATSTGRKIPKPSSTILKNTQQAIPPITGVTAPANASTGKATTTNEVSPELRDYMERKTLNIINASNLSLGTAAINGVEKALSPLLNEVKVHYIGALKAHLRTTIAQFVTRDLDLPISTLPPRPPRPANNITYREHPLAGSKSCQPIQIFEPTTADPMTVEPKTWASITKRAQPKSSAPVNHGHGPPKQQHTPLHRPAPASQPKRRTLRGKTRDSFFVSEKNTTGANYLQLVFEKLYPSALVSLATPSGTFTAFLLASR